jgi:uncharacterized peroxidase-related enzyme
VSRCGLEISRTNAEPFETRGQGGGIEAQEIGCTSMAVQAEVGFAERSKEIDSLELTPALFWYDVRSVDGFRCDRRRGCRWHIRKRSLATGTAKQLLDMVQAQLGVTPNLMRTLATAPAALKGFLDLNAALGRGVLDHKFREQIALTVAQVNACDYCLGAHAALGGMVGLSAADIAASRDARATDAKRDAGLKFASAVVNARGQVSDTDFLKARTAGLSDAEITEIIANVALNILTNYVNHVAQTTFDFPAVEATTHATA